MTDVILVSADWLTLREDADARSRSRRLARAAARHVRGPIVVHDLGSGTGSMMRWLAPFLPGPQTWVLHDWNRDLLTVAVNDPGRDAASRPVSIVTSVEHVEHLRPEHLAGASLVTASALLDVLTRDEVESLVAACVETGAPTLLSLSVIGRIGIEPADPGDRVFEAAFNDHQRRTEDGRALLGPGGVAAAVEAFRRAGWVTRVAGSAWRLGAADVGLVAEWLEGWVSAAVEQRPALLEWGEEYLVTRRRQLAAGVLRVNVHHADLLACPP
ncbi:SAM-dependent methyltransferase [Microbacterium sp. NPDC019599]|uniref:SAM-dependent methyltransferase n=1 Tax=Microbacterium sp. NPDC019599 TaxID=3154690 RepID=UPI00340D6171